MSEYDVPLDLPAIETRLQILEWRDEQLETITSQLEDAFPKLQENILKHVSELSTFEVTKAHVNPRKLAEKLIEPWTQEQVNQAVTRAEASLSELMSTLPLDNDISGHLKSALPAVAGVSMLAASVLSLPAVISFATVTSTSFLFVSTSTVSIPLLLAGGTVLTGMSLAGVKAMDFAKDKMRLNLADRVMGIARSAVFGHGLDPDARCVLNDLQAMVLKAGQAELEAVV